MVLFPQLLPDPRCLPSSSNFMFLFSALTKNIREKTHKNTKVKIK